MNKSLFAASAISLCLTTAAAQAQDTNANATYETVTLSGGFTPDPYPIDVYSGGTTDAGNIGCDGFIANAPDVRLNFTAGALPLIISATSSEDTTLVVNAPDGQWYCDDDSGNGFDPEVSFNSPMSGRYEVWVGTFGNTGSHAARVNISELYSSSSGSVSNQSAVIPDVSANPNYQTASLSGGFTPDPYVVYVSSGGSIPASNISPECAGYVSMAPDVRLNFSPGSLPLFITSESSADTTLVVNAPDGQWYCDDDSGDGMNPLITFDRPLNGRYEIWVGTFGDTSSSQASLRISEIDAGFEVQAPPPRPQPNYRPAPPRPQANYKPAPQPAPQPIFRPAPQPVQPAGPDINASPIYEDVRLSSGFTPDPYVVRMSSGGTNDASRLSSACDGFIATSPDVRLTFDAGSLPLIISATSMADTTLVINAPNGQWYCNDDGGQGMNPSVRFQTPLSGRYEIWVGTYGESNSHAAELNISELYSQ
ncbi:hypothetical protein [Aurantiacibacter marinus]|uniref:hypothetical protein n=1 Tax=Aurantiacibacter marinus TaxID=874156 RepID=UPI0007ECBFA1|nr:hypothetical protein [Aurantiacibacter marinus]